MRSGLIPPAAFKRVAPGQLARVPENKGNLWPVPHVGFARKLRNVASHPYLKASLFQAQMQSTCP